MDGVFTRCPATHPETGNQCIRLQGHDEDHMRPTEGSWTGE